MGSAEKKAMFSHRPVLMYTQWRQPKVQNQLQRISVYVRGSPSLHGGLRCPIPAVLTQCYHTVKGCFAFLPPRFFSAHCCIQYTLCLPKTLGLCSCLSGEITGTNRKHAVRLTCSKHTHTHTQNEEEHRRTKRVVNFCLSVLEQQQLRGFRRAAGFPRSVQCQRVINVFSLRPIDSFAKCETAPIRKSFRLAAKDVATLTR